MGPIGIFDSGYGGLTVFKEIAKVLPAYDYIYLGDNARVPYGTRSFETVYMYTLECVEQLFSMGCQLVILACNTASAKALRTIQQKDLVAYTDTRKVLGVIRPTTEIIGHYTKTRQVGIMATSGTVNSHSYILEVNKFFPDITVYQEACPMWVPLVENNEINSPGARYFVKQHVQRLLNLSSNIDTIVLACTHYPLLLPIIQNLTPEGIRLLTQGHIVAKSLADYLSRHSEIDLTCSKNGIKEFYTTESPKAFNQKAALFYGERVSAKHLKITNS
ncbi:glutamate racemase [Olivibacter sp. SDN3]|uniref:glutamate racemase n=1 Tax=Olivibacter sp. SDN3 TaxID=2764720 RepID=UPI001650E1D5|nr:glutamate racemase [Olivibacter sp. SDN3]QNL48438.1 glutamate racemase [Olivibacter sp. SDN3]